jgi:NAD(P)H dehydrogenase (quinone)
LAMGKWFTATGQGRAANVARMDCAASVAAVLMNGSHESRTYTLTGPKLYTTEEVAALVTKTTSLPLSVIHVTDEQLAEGMKAAGVPAGFVPVAVSFDTNTRIGNMDILTQDVEILTGRKPQTLDAFLVEHKAALGG